MSGSGRRGRFLFELARAAVPDKSPKPSGFASHEEGGSSWARKRLAARTRAEGRTGP